MEPKSVRFTFDLFDSDERTVEFVLDKLRYLTEIVEDMVGYTVLETHPLEVEDVHEN